MKNINLKEIVAEKAIQYITLNSIVGIGSGTTVCSFIQALSKIKNNITGVVSSSHASTMYLKKYGIRVLDINAINSISVYVDGADEITRDMQMIKGGGGALTGEKIIAEIADKFICIIDESKLVKKLGRFPLPVEVIPMAESYIIRELAKLGGNPQRRKNVITDYGNFILDVYDLNILNPVEIEKKIDALPGVVTVGLFAQRKADIVLMSTKHGIVQVWNN
ncbi:ribose-5-phosphate isomerase RpiA [Buchnera aphidicola (Hormaphis cornu)]|nr:ribose-5-phosphate isomerase RpiA [Buchnera aphidicola (Hormaphis cornu)]